MPGSARRFLAVVVIVAAPACWGCAASDDRPDLPAVVVDPSSGDPVDRAIAGAQGRLDDDPDDDEARLALASAYLDKARATADPTFYVRADALLDDLAERRDDDHRVLVARATLALARHEFEEALELGQRAVAVAPANPAAHGVLVDAYTELGRYDAALDATQRMADLRPDLPALARVSYARELRGDIDGAIVAMTQAATAGAGGGEEAAFAQTQLGLLLVTRGDLDRAEAAFAAAEAAQPGHPAARAGRARLLVARGEPEAAADLLEEVLQVQPLAEYAIARGEALTAAGRHDDAARAYQLVEAIAALDRANGVDVDLELALFDAMHDPGPDAVERARRALARRPTIHAHDALAWNLFQVGQVDEALEQARRATALGTKDPQLRYHAAAIAAAAGQRQEAAAHLRVVLDTNPRFSAVLADEVAALALTLGLSAP